MDSWLRRWATSTRSVPVRVTVTAWEVDCPLCTATGLESWGEQRRIPPHLTEGGVTCNASRRTLAQAQETRALRLRAHP